MKNFSLALTYLVSASLGLAACSSSTSGGGGTPSPAVSASAPVKNSKPAPGLIVVFGDSLAYGEGATTENAKIYKCIERNFPKYTVSRYAQNGITSTDGVQRLDAVLGFKPKAVIISLGGNDVIQDMFGTQKFTAETTFANLHSVYKALADQGVMAVQLGLNPPATPGAERLAKIKGVAESEGALFVPDIFEGLWGDQKKMADEFHPNDAGYAVVCQKIVRYLTPNLQ